MRYTALTQNQYIVLRNAIIEATEEFDPVISNVQTTRGSLPYADSLGFPTVGLGIRTDIASNVDVILQGRRNANSNRNMGWCGS